MGVINASDDRCQWGAYFICSMNAYNIANCVFCDEAD